VISQDVALGLELIGVDLTSGKAFFEDALCLGIRVRSVIPGSKRSRTVMEAIVTVRERTNRPNDDQDGEHQKEQ